MEELKILLINVSDSYYDFVTGMLDVAKKSEYRKNKLIDYIKSNPKAKTSDIIRYTMDDLGLYSEYRENNKSAILA